MMDATPFDAAGAPASPLQPSDLWRKIRHLLFAVAAAAPGRVTSPPRDLPPEFFRFPLP